MLQGPFVKHLKNIKENFEKGDENVDICTLKSKGTSCKFLEVFKITSQALGNAVRAINTIEKKTICENL